MSCLRCFCLFTYSVSSSLYEGSCLAYVVFASLRIVSLVLCRRDHVLFTLFLFVYVQCLQFFVGGIMSCLRCVCLFTYSVSSSLQDGSYVLFTLVLFVYVQCLQFFVGGIMSCLRCFCLFTYSVSSSLQEGSCLAYVVFACLRIVSPVLCRMDHMSCLRWFCLFTYSVSSSCRRDHVLFTLVLFVYVQCPHFFVRGIISCLRCCCLFTYSVSSSLQEGSCLVYVGFVCLRIVSPVLCKRDHVLLTLFLLVYVQCLQFFVRGIMSCLRWFCLFTYSVSSSLQGDHVLFTLFLFVCVQCLQFFVRGIMFCLRCFCLFTYSVSSSLYEGSCLAYDVIACLRIVSPVLCRRDHVLFTLFLFVYVQCLQFFVGGIMSCLRCVCLFTCSVSSSLQEGSCLVYVVFVCLRIVSPVLCRRDHVLFTLVLFVYIQCLQFFVGWIICLVYVGFVCLRIVSPVLCRRDHVLFTLVLFVYVQCLHFFVRGIMSCLRWFCLFTYSVSSSL